MQGIPPRVQLNITTVAFREICFLGLEIYIRKENEILDQARLTSGLNHSSKILLIGDANGRSY